jgi:hypothetical protein
MTRVVKGLMPRNVDWLRAISALSDTESGATAASVEGDAEGEEEAGRGAWWKTLLSS